MSTFLNRRVLLLNQSYEPIMVVGAKRAIILILGDKVEPLENYSEIIHSAYLSLPMPSVIKLREYARIKRKGIVLSRRNVLKRDNHECQYCGSPIKGVDLNSVPTEDVIRYANKWIGLMEELPSSGWMHDVGKEDTIFSQPKLIQKADINSNVKEYLGLLDVRSDKDALAKRKYSQLILEDALNMVLEMRTQLYMINLSMTNIII